MKRKQKRFICCLLAFIITAAAVALDQFTKYLAIDRLKGQEPFVIWKNVFQLDYLENRGAAFGLFQDQRFFFYLSVILIVGLIICFFIRVPLERHYLPLMACAVLIAAGALGNCIDRVRLNYVVDFFYFKLIDFPIFNVADIYVTAATCYIVWLILFYYKEDDFERVFHGGM